MRRIVFFGIVAALAGSMSAARAWDPLGHMLTMEIASGELTPATRDAVDKAIARFSVNEKPDAPYDLVTAACWMDDARARTKEFNEWHYVNLPFVRDGLPIPEGSRAAPNVIWGIEQCVAILEGKVEEPGIDRDMALMILLHLAGDIQQPLHATNRDDMGGNKVAVGNLKDEQSDLIFSRGGNLHFFWDSAYRRVFRDGDASVEFAAPLYPRQTPVAGHQKARDLVVSAAEKIRAEFPAASLAGASGGDARAWALESHVLGYDFAYAKLPDAAEGLPVALTGEYVEGARGIAGRQIALAGYRIANLLNRLFDPSRK